MPFEITKAATDADYEAANLLIRDMAIWVSQMVRTVTEADPAVVEAIYPEDAAALHQMFDAPGAALLLAYKGEVPLGCCGYFPHSAATAEVGKFWVAPTARGAGVGQGLLAAILAELPRRGYIRACLETGTFMTSAIALYLAHGFRHCPPFRTPIPGLGQNDLFMDLTLPVP